MPLSMSSSGPRRRGVAPGPRVGYDPGSARRARRNACAVLALLSLIGCASAAPEPDRRVIQPGVEERVVAETAPARSRRTVFDWTFRDRDARFTGKGVARTEPAYRGRLDLFGPRGEGYLQAVLIGDSLRLPSGVAAAPLPPPALLWSTLGVVRPPRGVELVHATAGDDRTELVYSAGDERWRYVLSGGRLQLAEHDRPKLGRETVELEYKEGLAVPARSVYRDWAAFRELVLTVDEVNDVDTFPPETWTLGGP